MKNVGIILNVSILLTCAGCVILPVPEHYSREFGTRGQIVQKTLEFMRAGSTTKEQVILNLGEPDRSLNNGRVFLYVWQMVVAVVRAYGGGRQIPITYLLLIEFDENNVVGRSEIRKGFFVLQAVLDEMEAR